MNFYKCLSCGDIALKIGEKDGLLSCCDERMKKIVPGEIEASVEKHIPVIKQEENQITVEVGETEHPMIEVHYIMWIVLQTESGFSLKYLKPEEAPKAVFHTDEKVVAAYAYCNLHGLWKATV
ncbi:MAG: desulfoferrodoxin family protein [Bacilli bacterium]|nr:desulfoferrodoxin family protein [Bacilli bacterium]